ncbi:unnamed protein product [Bemisia tabaci]|uniref:FAD dependent oxidoreductase domain-containing protein n=1 Tax=Bemisia tabaci TaxID=7038 RepID=A0A9N9ZZM2_BEMTA|nr:unnamed protein product [Bemisia tabaci]
MGSAKVCVLGAGIVGLNTALLLQKEYPELRITLIADKINEETTSDGAAGIFRPGTSFQGPSEEITNQWIIDSYEHYESLLDDYDAGVSELSGFIFSDTDETITKNHFLENLVPEYREASGEELTVNSKTWKYGAYFTTLLINSSYYLPWALKKFTKQNGILLKKSINSFQELENDYNIIFNCCGLGAKKLCGDKKVVPIRGQVIKVFAPWLKNFYYSEYDTYILPSNRDGVVTLGGCRQYESYSVAVSRHDTAAILERCYELLPALKDAPILREWVGLRPHRSEVRVEAEKIGKLLVIHNYGHGGYGVTAAPGTAKFAVDILKDISFLPSAKL